MGIIIGLVVTLGCVLGGYMAMGGYISVLNQPWEFVIIGGAAIGTFLVANPMVVVKDAGKGLGEVLVILYRHCPAQRQYGQRGILTCVFQSFRIFTASRRLRVVGFGQTKWAIQ